MFGGFFRGSSAPALGALGCALTRFLVPVLMICPSPAIRKCRGSGLLVLHRAQKVVHIQVTRNKHYHPVSSSMGMSPMRLQIHCVDTLISALHE